ncbi:MAG: DNA polymerase III subunit epsilon [Oxalobacteraceae bacterium]
MRQIVLDTETTGLNPRSGDRIIEIGCVELVNRRLTGNNFHYYVNPERDSDPGALAVHGLTTDFLSDKPKFAEIAKALCDYLRDAEIIIHNAPFDVGFLDAEFEKLGLPKFDQHVRLITDTLLQAKELHPGKRNSLDALCERYGVSNAHRTLHGALLDSELLAEVYLAMTRGQDSLGMDLTVDVADADGSSGSSALAEIMVLSPLPEEIAAHQEMLQALNKESKGACLWLQDGP